jgi:hypothetical protein
MCDLATKLPQLVANLLDREGKLKRGRFREETMTDIFTGALTTFAGPELVIEYPPEAATGGDLDLDFWNVGSNRRLLVRLQAKRLNAATSAGRLVAVNHRSYNELLHRVPKTSGPYQYRTLLGGIGTCLPLYMFYNHGAVTRDPFFRSAGPKVSGINLAFAQDIADELDAKLAARPNRLHHKRLSHLRQHFFSLESIFCPPGGGPGIAPSPDDVSRSLVQVWETVARGDDAAEAIRISPCLPLRISDNHRCNHNSIRLEGARTI